MAKLINKRSFTTLAPITLLSLTAGFSGAAMAVDVGDKFEIHGMGYQNYLRTTDNTFLGANNQGYWGDNLFSLLFVTKLQESTKIWAKVDNTSEKSRLDWAFIDYEFSNNLTLKVGQVKTPIGLYAQVIDNKYLQLSTLPPLLYHDAADLVEKSYRGVGAAYEHDIGAGGNLALDAYAGQIVDPSPPDFGTGSNQTSTKLRGGARDLEDTRSGTQIHGVCECLPY